MSQTAPGVFAWSGWVESWRRATLANARAYGRSTIVTGLLVSAGVLHMAIAPQHADHAPAHGLFFAILGSVQIGLALAFLRHPSRLVASLGILVSGGSFSLWTMSRILRAPFETHPESVDAFGLVIKSLEALTMVVVLWYWGALGPGFGTGRGLWRWGVVLVVGGLALGVAGYFGAILAEPLLPGLAGEGHPHGH